MIRTHCTLDKIFVFEVVDRPQSQQVLSTRWVSKQRLDGSYKVRLVARGFEQTVSSDADFFAGMPKLTTLRGLLTIAALHGNLVAFGVSVDQEFALTCLWLHRKMKKFAEIL